MIRSVAEQLVCEANAVLRPSGEVISLDDECGPGALAFTVGYRGRSARVRTEVSGRYAEAHLLIGWDPDYGPHRLVGDEELQALLLTLIHVENVGS
jgi:hypothetical protein